MTGDVLDLSQQLDSSVFGKPVHWFQSQSQWSVYSSMPRVAGVEERVFTVPDKDILQLQRILDEARQQLETLAASSELEPDLPEVFNLRPLSSQRVTVKVLKDEPARFYFVAEGEISPEAVED